MITKLEQKAAALVASNCAKYKAEGMTHRIELPVCGPRGAYLRTAVFYTKSGAMESVGSLALRAGTKCISASIAGAQISAL